MHSTVVTFFKSAAGEVSKAVFSHIYEAVDYDVNNAIHSDMVDTDIRTRRDRRTECQSMTQKGVGRLINTVNFISLIIETVKSHAEIAFMARAKISDTRRVDCKEREEAK